MPDEATDYKIIDTWMSNVITCQVDWVKGCPDSW